MKGILVLVFLCATSQFAHGHLHHLHHSLLGKELLGMTATVLSALGSAYSEPNDTETETEVFDESSEEEEDEEIIKQSRSIFSAGSAMKKRLCQKICKKTVNHVLNKTDFSTPNSVSFRFFKIEPRQDSVRFKVKAANDAYVVLTAGLDPKDPRYEVRFGILANYQTFITKDKFGVSVATAITPQILSKDEFREFWIKWDEGTIRVGKSHEKHAFVAYADAKLFNVTHLGFGTRWGAQGIWIVQGIGNEAER